MFLKTTSRVMIGMAVTAAALAQSVPEEQTMRTIRAQDSGDDSSSYAAGTESSATGLALSPRDTPQSVSVITPEQIKDQGMTTVADALRSATGVSRTTVDRVRTEITVRGFNVDSYQYDGVPVPTGNNVNHDLASTVIYDRIEMVRGATGLLNGAGQPSATINMIRKHADSKQFSASIGGDIGRWDYKSATADVSAPLNGSGSVRARVIASGTRQKSFIDWEETESHVFYGVLDADLGDATRLSLGISHQQDNRDDVLWAPLPIWYSDGSHTDWARSKNTAANWNEWLTQEDTTFLTLEHRFDSEWTLRMNASYHKNIDDETLMWWDGVPDRNTGLGVQMAGYQWANISKLAQISGLLSGSFNWFGREHEVSAGLLYSDFESRWDDIHDDPNAYTLESDFNHWNGTGYPEPVWGNVYLGAKDTTRQFAGYAVARFNFHDDWKLITGARITNWRWHTQQAAWTPESVEVKKNGIVTPYIGAVYNLTDHVSAYASYTSIFKPQTNYRDRNGKYLDPLEGNSFELGIKGAWLDGLLNASAAVFYTDQDNFAVEDGQFTVPGTIDTQAYLAGQGVKSEGYELEVVGDLSANWSISASWTQYSAKDAQDVDVSVDHPRRLFKLYTTYEFSEHLSGLKTGGGVNWQSRQLRRTANPATGELEAVGEKAYALIDAMVSYAITPQFDVQLNAYNLLDKKYKSTSFWDAYTWGEPRNWRLSMTYAFK